MPPFETFPDATFDLVHYTDPTVIGWHELYEDPARELPPIEPTEAELHAIEHLPFELVDEVLAAIDTQTAGAIVAAEAGRVEPAGVVDELAARRAQSVAAWEVAA